MSTIEAAVDDLLNNRQLTAAEALDRYFGPAFRQRTNGSWDDRTAVLARAIQLRDLVEHATITVLDELAVGDRYAERHLIDLRHRDGTRTVQEVYLFAERDADGRFTRIEETAVVWRD